MWQSLVVLADEPTKSYESSTHRVPSLGAQALAMTLQALGELGLSWMQDIPLKVRIPLFSPVFAIFDSFSQLLGTPLVVTLFFGPPCLL